MKKRPSSSIRQSSTAKRAAQAAEKAAARARATVIDVEAKELGAPDGPGTLGASGFAASNPKPSAAKLKTLVQLLRQSLDPAAMQWVLGGVLAMAIDGYARAEQDLERQEQAQEHAQEQEKNNAQALLAAQESPDADTQSLLADAKMGSPEDEQRDGIPQAIKVLVRGPQGHATVPLDVQILLAQVANAPVSDGLSLMEQMRIKLSMVKWSLMLVLIRWCSKRFETRPKILKLVAGIRKPVWRQMPIKSIRMAVLGLPQVM